MKESEKINILIQRIIIMGLSTIILFAYFTIYPLINNIGLPSGETTMIQIMIFFAVAITVITEILWNLYLDEKIKEEDSLEQLFRLRGKEN